MKIAPPAIIVAPGTHGMIDGFRAVVVRHYDGNMYEIRLPGGVTCQDVSYFKPDAPSEQFTAQVAAYRARCVYV